MTKVEDSLDRMAPGIWKDYARKFLDHLRGAAYPIDVERHKAYATIPAEWRYQMRKRKEKQ